MPSAPKGPCTNQPRAERSAALGTVNAAIRSNRPETMKGSESAERTSSTEQGMSNDEVRRNTDQRWSFADRGGEFDQADRRMHINWTAPLEPSSVGRIALVVKTYGEIDPIQLAWMVNQMEG